MISAIGISPLHRNGGQCDNYRAVLDDFAPLAIQVSPGSFQTIRSVREAAQILIGWPRGLLGWPEGGAKRIAALRACLDALEGKGPAKTARRYFIEAAEEADIFVREGEHPLNRPGS